MSRTFSMNSGSVESLKVSARCGCRAKARQIRLTAVWLIPARLAMERVLQCVASGGVASSVSVITRSTSASVIARGAPGRGSSSKPSGPRSAKRRRQIRTVGRLTRSARATPLLVAPGSAQASSMRARRARAWAVVRRAPRPALKRLAVSRGERKRNGARAAGHGQLPSLVAVAPPRAARANPSTHL